MKRSQIFRLLSFTFILSHLLALAASVSHADPRSRGGNSASFSLGLSTIEPASSLSSAVTGVQGVGVGNSASVTGMIHFSQADSVQILLSIPRTKFNFNIFGTGLYKRTVMGSKAIGLHVGGGFGLGAVTGDFGFIITALGGLHFEIPHLSDVSVHLDGGPMFQFLDTSPNTTTNFQVAALSSALGLSVVYNF